MGIPFTQYVLPDGRKRSEHINRPTDIEAMADKFIASGGRYECEVLTTGEVSLTAVKDDGDVVIVICPNAPGVGEHVDELVRLSQAHC